MSLEALNLALKATPAVSGDMAVKIAQLTAVLQRYGVEGSPYNLSCVDMLLEFFYTQDFATDDDNAELKAYYAAAIVALNTYKRKLFEQYLTTKSPLETRAAFKQASSNMINWSEYELDGHPLTQPLYDFEQTFCFAEPRAMRYLSDHLYALSHFMKYRISLNQDIKKMGELSEEACRLVSEYVDYMILYHAASHVPAIKTTRAFSLSIRTFGYLASLDIEILKKRGIELETLTPHNQRSRNLAIKGFSTDLNSPYTSDTLWRESEAPGDLDYTGPNGEKRAKLTPEGKKFFAYRKQLLKEYADKIAALTAAAFNKKAAEKYQYGGELYTALEGTAYYQNDFVLRFLEVQIIRLSLMKAKDIQNQDKKKELEAALWKLSYLLENVESGAADGFEDLDWYVIPTFKIVDTEPADFEIRNQCGFAYSMTSPLGTLQGALLRKVAMLMDPSIDEVIPGKEAEFESLLDLAKKIMALRCRLIQDALNNPGLVGEFNASKNQLYLYSAEVAAKLLQVLPLNWEGFKDVVQLKEELASLQTGQESAAQSSVAYTGISHESRASAHRVMLACMAIGLIAGCIVAAVMLGMYFTSASEHIIKHIASPVKHVGVLLSLEIVGGLILGATTGVLCYQYQNRKRAGQINVELGVAPAAPTSLLTVFTAKSDEEHTRLYDETMKSTQRVTTTAPNI